MRVKLTIWEQDSPKQHQKLRRLLVLMEVPHLRHRWWAAVRQCRQSTLLLTWPMVAKGTMQ